MPLKFAQILDITYHLARTHPALAALFHVAVDAGLKMLFERKPLLELGIVALGDETVRRRVCLAAPRHGIEAGEINKYIASVQQPRSLADDTDYVISPKLVDSPLPL
jgi:hypothetical protein